MSQHPKDHFQRTKELAQALEKKEVYKWLVTKGYFPEAYVLPPCFKVTHHPQFGDPYFPVTTKNGKTKFKPAISEFQQVHFPKTDLTDRTFGIINPKIHSDIALQIVNNWENIISCIFNEKNQVYSYSFPIPLDNNKPEKIGSFRNGK